MAWVKALFVRKGSGVDPADLKRHGTARTCQRSWIEGSQTDRPLQEQQIRDARSLLWQLLCAAGFIWQSLDIIMP